MAATTAAASQRPLLPTSGRELLLDLKRSIAGAGPSNDNKYNSTLPTYNTKLVQSCLQELTEQVSELNLVLQALDRSQNNQDSDTSKSQPSFHMSARPVILLHSESIERYKRCLLAYHYQRMLLMQDIIRKTGNNNNNNVNDDSDGTTTTLTDNAETISNNKAISQNAAEVDFAQTYKALRQNYQATVGVELDMPMPVSNMVQVKVTKSKGRQYILPLSGRQVYLEAGATLYLEREDAKDLLQSGACQLLVEGEEVDY